MKHYKNNNITFVNGNGDDASNLSNVVDIDVVLLVDVIEHVDEPQKLIVDLLKTIKKKAVFIVSVPTPLYPKIFGEKFHKEVGHLVNGYSVEQLDALFETINSENIVSTYNTGIFGSIGCFFFYRIRTTSKFFYFIKSIVLHWFQYLDFVNNKKVSCSIFSVYERND